MRKDVREIPFGYNFFKVIQCVVLSPLDVNWGDNGELVHVRPEGFRMRINLVDHFMPTC